MKTIIIPTDFSANADNALRYAINLANHFESTIHLVHTFEVGSSTGSFVSIRDFLLEDAVKGLKKIKDQYKESLFHDTTLITKPIEGQTVDRICAYAKKIRADLIIMGTQGASGLKEIFLGSNTAGVLRHSHTPVLAVPSAYKYHPIKQISLAVDNQVLADEAVLSPLLQLAKAYKAKIDILHVFKSNVPEAVDSGIGHSLGDIPHKTFSVKHDNIVEGINYFVKDTDSDLICMIKRGRSFLERLFHSSVTRKEVFNSPVPILLLLDK